MVLVIVHDVATVWRAASTRIFAALRPLVGATCAAAVVPRWHGSPSLDTALATHLRAHCGEVLLHGYTHRAVYPWHPLALLTGQANELSGQTAAVAAARVRAGKAQLARWVAQPVRGFVPPAWQAGALTSTVLAACGIEYALYWSHLATTDGRRVALHSYSWDSGRIAALGILGEWAAAVRGMLTRRGVPCIVLHPADVARGYLPRSLALLRVLLAHGHQPTLPQHLTMHRAYAHAP